MQFLGLKICILLADKEKDTKYAHAMHCLQLLKVCTGQLFSTECKYTTKMHMKSSVVVYFTHLSPADQLE